MTDGEALFQAILANPADDLPRLVYADWLDDTGTDPARAEFIRVQCGPQTPAAVARADELLAEHRSRWETPGLLRPTHQVFRRGFVVGVRTTADRFLAAAERIGRMPGLTELQLSNAADRLADLAKVTWLPRVESLNLTNSVGLTKGIDKFLALPLPNLRSLELRNCQIWPVDMKALVDIAERFPLLERLNLSGNPLGNVGLAHLVERHFPRLSELVIRCDELQHMDAIHPSAMESLAESDLLGGLTRLDLAGHYLTDLGLMTLATSRRTQRLEWLDVSGNRIGRESSGGIEAVVASPALGRLRVLRIGRSVVSPDAAAALAGWDRLNEMDEVNLTGCEFLPGARELLGGLPFVTDDDYRDAAMTSLLLATLLAATNLAVKTTPTDPPAELSDAVKKLLPAEAFVVSDADGTVVAEFWIRSELPSRATADQVKNGVTYRELPEGLLVGSVRLPRPFVDYRKQTIPAGAYTLRFAVQPDIGDHKDTAPHSEFLLLCPAAKDTTDDALEAKDVQKLSAAVTGDHPAVLLLFPNREKPAAAKLVDRKDGVMSLDFQRVIVADGGKTTLGFALSVSGHSPKR